MSKGKFAPVTEKIRVIRMDENHGSRKIMNRYPCGGTKKLMEIKEEVSKKIKEEDDKLAN